MATTKSKTTSKNTKTSKKSKKSPSPSRWLKPLLIGLAGIVAIFAIFYFIFKNNQNTSDYIVETNGFFAPFEYYQGPDLAGVDIDIIHRVAEKMDKTIKIENVDFSTILDNVAAGKVADAGIAGFTITEARAEKVDFSIPYYKSTQYVIYNSQKPINSHPDFIIWEDLKDKTIGLQTDTTGWLFAHDEVESGSLADTKTALKGFDSVQLAADGIFANITDAVVIDELAARYIVSKNANLNVLPLYFNNNDGTFSPVEESYAVAVNKNRPELLEAINKTLEEMLANDEINQLVIKHMGL